MLLYGRLLPCLIELNILNFFFDVIDLIFNALLPTSLAHVS